MHEIRLVGRGGQGIVTAGELLGAAAVREGQHAQAIPTFGPERRGALSSCTLRLSDEPILAKYSSTQPDVLVLLDPTIWHSQNVTLGLKEGSTLLFNTRRTPQQIDDELTGGTHGYTLGIEEYTLSTVDATGIALEVLKRPITNTAVMGALSGATGYVKMESIEAVLAERFGAKGAANIEAARAANSKLQRLQKGA